MWFQVGWFGWFGHSVGRTMKSLSQIVYDDFDVIFNNPHQPITKVNSFFFFFWEDSFLFYFSSFCQPSSLSSSQKISFWKLKKYVHRGWAFWVEGWRMTGYEWKPLDLLIFLTVCVFNLIPWHMHIPSFLRLTYFTSHAFHILNAFLIHHCVMKNCQPFKLHFDCGIKFPSQNFPIERERMIREWISCCLPSFDRSKRMNERSSFWCL